MSNYYNKNAIPIKSISPSLGLDKTKEFKKKLEIKNRNKSSKDMFKKTENKAKGGRVGLKRGTSLIPKKKSNIQKIQETFGPKKKVPNKFKGFSKLPEKVQQKIDAKLAKKV